MRKYAAKSVNEIYNYSLQKIQESSLSEYIKLNLTEEIKSYIDRDFYDILKDERDIYLNVKEPEEVERSPLADNSFTGKSPEEIIQAQQPDPEKTEIISALRMIRPAGLPSEDLNTLDDMSKQEILNLIDVLSHNDFLLKSRIDAYVKTTKAAKRLKPEVQNDNKPVPVTEAKETLLTEGDERFINERLQDIPSIITEKLFMTGRFEEKEIYGESVSEVQGVIYQESLQDETIIKPDNILEMYDNLKSKSINVIQKLNNLLQEDYFEALKEEVYKRTIDGKLKSYLYNQEPLKLSLIDIAFRGE